MTKPPDATTPIIYTRVAGFTYILIIIIGVLYGVFVESRLIVAGNEAATAVNIMADDRLFRIGIAGLLILYAAVVLLSWSLYVILKTVNENLAFLAMILRLAEAVLGGATVLLSFIALAFLQGEGYAAIFGTEQLHALAVSFLQVHTAALDMVLIFVGLGGTVFCYLLLKSRYVPGGLAVWGIFTYLSMLMLALVSIIFPAHPVMLATVLYSLGGLFELIIGCWLLFKGVNLREWERWRMAIDQD